MLLSAADPDAAIGVCGPALPLPSLELAPAPDENDADAGKHH